MAKELSTADPPRNFTLTTDERIRALTIGPPAYAVRKRKIEDTEDRWIAILVALHDTLAGRGLSLDAIGQALADKAESFDYARQNALVAAHNRWYPIEANLRIDPRTGGYLAHGRPWLPEPEYDAARVLARVREMLASG